MAYDADRRVVLLFGGISATGGLGDTWAWNGSNWTQLRPATSPSARHGHAMAFDRKRRRVVLTAGYGQSRYLNDTWLWDGKNWQYAGPLTFSALGRAAHAMAYDERGERVVLFGGFHSSSRHAGRFNDTALWDGKAWTLVRTARVPRARASHAMTYDAARCEIVLVGGHADRPPLRLNDTWLWNGSSWSKAAPPSSPPVRFLHSLVWDYASQRALLFGGISDGNGMWPLGDTWTFGVTGFNAYGAGCGNPRASLSPRSDPRIGRLFTLRAWNLAPVARVGLLAFGASKAKVDLRAAGMPGCWLLQSNDVLFGFPVHNGVGNFALWLPNSSSLVGLKPLMQAFVNNPRANAAQWLTTNGGEAFIRR